MQRNGQESDHVKGCSRINKHNQAQMIYQCECGKNYLTFSALYLHAHLKHEVRLTTRRTQSNHKMEKKGNKSIVTYFLNEGQNISQNQYNNKKKVQNDSRNITKKQKFTTQIKLINQYLETLKTRIPLQAPQQPLAHSVLKHLIEYFVTLRNTNPNAKDQEESQNDITLYFNEFSTYYMPFVKGSTKVQPFQIYPVVDILRDFYKWLKEANYTDVKLICHAAYSPTAAQQS